MFAFWRRIPRAEKWAVSVSLTLGVGLLALKFFAYAVTHSSAIFADAVESIVNVMASLVALWALALAHTPPDERHPYGHGKVEFISAAFEGGMILLAALFIFVETIDAAFFAKQQPQQTMLGFWLVLLAMVLNGAAGLGLVRLGRVNGSATLVADGKHLLADGVTSAAVVVALLLVRLTGWHWIDPAVALGVSVYIAVLGVRVGQESFGGLMDEQDAGDERRLVELLDGHVRADGPEPRICSYHKLRHRHSGRYHWVDFHLMVPRELSVADGHRIASRIEGEMERLLGTGNATAHVEPCDAGRCERCGSGPFSRVRTGEG